MRQASIYIHIPFCVQKCGYCDFAVSLYKDRDGIRRYLDAIKKEMLRRLELLEALEAPSIYFGGGTPSLLQAEEVAEILDHLRKRVRWAASAEITLEANPLTFDLTRAQDWKRLGVNRVSLGAQSFNLPTLKKLGRLHTPEDTGLSFHHLKEAGIHSVNLDVIYGLPDEPIEDLSRPVEKALSLGPDHISFYQLAIEENTPFYRLAAKNRLALPPEEAVMEMYELASGAFEEAGLAHYELQNFARSGHASVHNYRYWRHEEFLGFGVGAYSYFDGKRFGHGKSLDDYLNKVASGDLSPEVSETITEDIRMKEVIILGLRLRDGIDPAEAELKLGRKMPLHLSQQLDRLVQNKLLRKHGRRYLLTLKGEHLSESVASELI